MRIYQQYVNGTEYLMIKSTTKIATENNEHNWYNKEFNRIYNFLLLPFLQTNISIGQKKKLVEQDDHT